MILSILGPQGSGKGTQAQLLVDRFGFSHIETGKLLREIAESDSVIANSIKETMNSGALVSDEVLSQVLESHLTNEVLARGVVFDGTPRNLAQYLLINNLLAKFGCKLDYVVYLGITDLESVKRISARRTCRICGRVYNLITHPAKNEGRCDCGGDLEQREDDVPESIQRRLSTYHKETSAVIEKAREDRILIEIDGSGPIETISENIIKNLRLE